MKLSFFHKVNQKLSYYPHIFMQNYPRESEHQPGNLLDPFCGYEIILFLPICIQFCIQVLFFQFSQV